MRSVRGVTFYCWQASGIYPPPYRPENFNIVFAHTAPLFVHDWRGPCEVIGMRTARVYPDFIRLDLQRRRMKLVYTRPWMADQWYAPWHIAPFVRASFIVRDFLLRTWLTVYHRIPPGNRKNGRAPWPLWLSFGM